MKKYEAYLQTPFKVLGIEERQYTTKHDEEVWQMKDGDDLYAVRKIPKNKMSLSDTSAYTKLFNDNLKDLMNLTGTGLRLLVYGACTIRPLSQTVVYHIPDIQVATGISSPNTIKAGITDLIENKIIAQKLGSNIEFWVNPNVYFNGNRLRLL
jgi:hypothetical protein